MHATSIRISRIHFLVLTAIVVFLCAAASSAQTLHLPTATIYAQKVVNETLAAHSDIMGLEISAASVRTDECTTIASDEEKGIGEKCDQDEYAAMKTNKPFVDQTKDNGKQFYEVNIAIHDANGKVLAVVGIDFKPDPKQTVAQASERAQQIAKEIEAKVPSREKLYEPVS